MDRHRSRIEPSDPCEQRMLEVTPARQGWQPGGLGHGEEHAVLVQRRDRQRSVGLTPRRPVPDHRLTAADGRGGSAGAAFERDLAGADTVAPGCGGRVPVSPGQVRQQREAVGNPGQRFPVVVALIHLVRVADGIGKLLEIANSGC